MIKIKTTQNKITNDFLKDLKNHQRISVAQSRSKKNSFAYDERQGKSTLPEINSINYQIDTTDEKRGHRERIFEIPTPFNNSKNEVIESYKEKEREKGGLTNKSLIPKHCENIKRSISSINPNNIKTDFSTENNIAFTFSDMYGIDINNLDKKILINFIHKPYITGCCYMTKARKSEEFGGASTAFYLNWSYGSSKLFTSKCLFSLTKLVANKERRLNIGKGWLTKKKITLKEVLMS